MKKVNYRDQVAIYSIISVFPPFAILMIMVGWFRGEKVNTLSVVGLFVSIVFTIIMGVQLFGK